MDREARMRILKQMKDPENTVQEALGTDPSAQRDADTVFGGPDFEPIAGVSLDQYVEISRGLAEYGYDQSKAVDVAASKGVPPESWQRATTGWNERIKASPAVARHFNKLYTGR
jgi:hypothetical protein